MLDQPTNNNCYQRRRTRFSIVAADNESLPAAADNKIHCDLWQDEEDAMNNNCYAEEDCGIADPEKENSLSASQDQNNIITWPVIPVRKAHSRAFAWQKTPDCELIVWLAEIMINLHRNRVRRARWSGPCGHLRGCRFIP